MLPKSVRLPVQQRLRESEYIQTELFSLRIAKNSEQQSRFGFIVSKKVAKLAVDRNRIKRKLATQIYELLPQIAKGYDMLFVAKPRMLAATQTEVATVVQQILSTRKLLA